MQIDVNGIPARQNEYIHEALDALYKWDEATSNVVEIGTYAGGFAYLLSDHENFAGATIYSYDVDGKPAEPYEDILIDVDIHFKVRDVFEGDVIQEIRHILRRLGRSVLFCDGGNKKLEFKIFAPMLKSGDIILAHDLGTEIQEKDVEDLCKRHGFDPYMQDIFTPAKWLIRRKR